MHAVGELEQREHVMFLLGAEPVIFLFLRLKNSNSVNQKPNNMTNDIKNMSST